MSVYDQFCHEARAMGIRLFTISLHDPKAGLVRRVYSSDPSAYPVSGTKPVTDNAWTQQVLGRGEAFVANEAHEFEVFFPDHAQIVALGCRSCANLPILRDGEVRGTANLLAEAAHFTPERLGAYQALVQQHRAALWAEMAQMPLG
ncbi:MAG: GAF domain-containing protein [Pseudorhodobacter sp.]